MARCFGTIKKEMYGSDITNKKSAQLTYCNSTSTCNNITHANSYDQINLYNYGKSLSTCYLVQYNKNNLVAGLYTNEDLTDVPVLCDRSNACCRYLGDCTINPTKIILIDKPFYEYYRIDPRGLLFGKSACGIFNYTHYMKYK
jgi:hypothetical protein